MAKIFLPRRRRTPPASPDVPPRQRRGSFGRGSSKTTKHYSLGQPKKPRRTRRLIIRSILVLLALLIVTGAFFGIKDIGVLDKVFHGNIISDIEALFNPVHLKGEKSGRVNILLAGDSVGDPGHQGAPLTDSILLLSINTRTHSAFLLSIPRDLLVKLPAGNYPGGTSQKINAANDITNFHMRGYPKGGMGALTYVVEHELGIPVDYYGLINYSAFKDAVSAVGGVRVDIQSPDPRGLYDPNANLNLPNGWVTLNGQEALNLARARGDGPGSYGFPSSDFDRTQHQRQIFVAVAKKAKSIGVLGNPVRISALLNTLGNNFQTNLSLADILRLEKLTKSFNLSSVKSYAFSSTLSSTSLHPILTTYYDPSLNEDTLTPTLGITNYSGMRHYYQQLIK